VAKEAGVSVMTVSELRSRKTGQTPDEKTGRRSHRAPQLPPQCQRAQPAGYSEEYSVGIVIADK